MKINEKHNGLLFFLCIITILSGVLFWQVFVKNQIPFSANLIGSFFNPWAQEKFPGWDSGIPNKPSGKDDIWIFYPQRTFTSSLLKIGEIPFWNPYSFTGNYHVGLSETAVFYPLNLIFLIFPQIDAWVFLILIEPIIAGVGMFLFLQKIAVYKKSAVLGALSFAFSGIVLIRSVEGLSVGHTLIWMPYIFWGIESFFQTKKIRFFYVIILPLTLSLLAGWLQYTFYIFVFSFAYSFFKLRFDSKNKIKFLYAICIPFLLLPFLTFFHTISAFQALLDSPRADLSGRVFTYKNLMPIVHIITLVVPDFWGNPSVFNYVGKNGDYKDSVMFIGVVPFIFSILSFFIKKNKKIIFFIVSIAVTLIFAINSPLSKAIISLNIPIFSSFLPNRIFLITTFSFCVLTAYGFDFILGVKKDTYRKVKNYFIFLLIIACVAFIFASIPVIKDPSLFQKIEGGINRNIEIIHFKSLSISLFFLFLTTIIVFIFKKKYTQNYFFIAIVMILFLQSFLFAQKNIPFSYRQFVYPKHPVFSYLENNQNLDRFMSIGYGHIVPSIPLQFGLYSPEGIGSMYIKRYGEFISYMELGEVRIPNKIAFDMEMYPQDFFNPKNQRLHRFYQLASVRHVVVDKKSMEMAKIMPDSNDFSLVWENKTWQIYEYKKSMPRFFVTSDFVVANNDKDILSRLFNNNLSPNKIILEEYPGFLPTDHTGKIIDVNYSSNKITVKLETEYNSLLYFSDNHSKMFKVLIDGKEGKMLRANYTFRAVPVEKGEHTVVVYYDSKPFVRGVQIAIFTFLVFGLLTYTYRKYF